MTKKVIPVVLICLFPLNVSADIVFETDFANDGEYFDTGTNLIRHTDLPEGFDGIRTNQGTISGAPGEGVGGSVALKFDWPVTTTPLATSLFKHLTGDPETGYDEVYVRYQVRLPNGFKAGVDGETGADLPYWKWGRLWQNAGLEGAGWTENREDAFYIVWNWGAGKPIWGIKSGFICGENLGPNRELGSAGGPRSSNDFYISGSDTPGAHIGFPGHWDNVGAGAWEFDHVTRELFDNSNQEWRTLEYRFKLSTSDTANDGVWQLWYDGVEQIAAKDMGTTIQAVDQPVTPQSIVTAAKPGFNLLVLFDNMSNWSRGWDDAGAEGGIYINDLVISTTRIGHEYVVGDPIPGDTGTGGDTGAGSDTGGSDSGAGAEGSPGGDSGMQNPLGDTGDTDSVGSTMGSSANAQDDSDGGGCSCQVPTGSGSGALLFLSVFFVRRKKRTSVGADPRRLMAAPHIRPLPTATSTHLRRSL